MPNIEFSCKATDFFSVPILKMLNRRHYQQEPKAKKFMKRNTSDSIVVLTM